ncbi:MAG: response regulator transcription factor [Propionibacteriaceae bacterium]|nr:response regulator transcription factor [Propionibacteriaceae bacterium]
MTDSPIKVLVVDDQALMRKGFALMLAAEPDLVVVGEAGDGEAALKAIATAKPDVVLMDVRMPGMNGIEATTRAVRDYPAVKIIVLTTFDLDEYAFAALKAGASGFLLKDVPPEELAHAIRAVAGGDAILSPRIARTMIDLFAPALPGPDAPRPQGAADPRLARLTEREIEVLKVIAEGLSNAEIAQRLFLSEATVKTHISRILPKLGLRDRTQAVVLAYETGLVTPSVGGSREREGV